MIAIVIAAVMKKDLSNGISHGKFGQGDTDNGKISKEVRQRETMRK